MAGTASQKGRIFSVLSLVTPCRICRYFQRFSAVPRLYVHVDVVLTAGCVREGGLFGIGDETGGTMPLVARPSTVLRTDLVYRRDLASSCQ